MSLYIYNHTESAVKISNAEIVYYRTPGMFIDINGTYIKSSASPFLAYQEVENGTCFLRRSSLSGKWEIHAGSIPLAVIDEPIIIAVSDSSDSDLVLNANWEWSENIQKYTSKTISLSMTKTNIYRKCLADGGKVYTTNHTRQSLNKTDRVYIEGNWYYFGLSNDDFYTGDLIATLTTGRTLRAKCINPTTYGTDRIWETYQGGISRSVSSNEERSLNGILNIHYSTSDMKWICYFEDNMTYGSGGKHPWQCRYISSDTAFDETIPINFITKG